MVGELTEAQIDAILREAQFARLGCHADGQTYVVPISFAYEGGNLIGSTTAGRKIEMMRKNPQVCVCVDDIVSLTDWKSVILWGVFEEVQGIEAARVTGLLIDKYGPIFEEMNTRARLGRNVTPDRLDGKDEPPVVYRIRIETRTGRFESGN